MTSKKRGVSRRGFLGGVVASSVGLSIVPRRVLGGAGFKAPSDTLAIAGIGVGGKGRSDVAGCEDEAIVALCDVDWKVAAPTFRAYPKAKRYKDFREMLEKEPGIDAVLVSTPDHTHATIAATAMRMGKHVFCQKPLTRTIHEARELARIARESGVVTQMGNQGHAGEGTRQIREWIEAGLIGTVSEIHYWTNRPIWPQAIDRPTEMHYVPAHLDWDLFLGPAPERPYHPAYHPFRWRGWWDFGTGALGDIACHSMDAAFWTFDLRSPESIVAETTPLYPETAPAASRIVYRFPATGRQRAMTVVWRDGSLMPPLLREVEIPDALPFPSGQLFVGEKGLLAAGIYGEDPRLFPDRLHEQVLASPPPEVYPRTKGVYDEWIEACKGHGEAGSSFPEHAGPLTEMVLLGNLAVRSGRPIEWNAAEGRVMNVPEANDLLYAEYREGWTL